MSAQDNSPKVGQTDNLKTIYQELCSSYHAIDDFRAKLLGFLPLATGTGLFLLLGNFKDVNKLDFCTPETKSFLIAVGVFGVMITLGLFAYELYGIKKCAALIHVGQCIERSLLERATHIDDGPFVSRPPHVAHIINEPFAAALIYPVVLAAWVFFAFFFARSQVNPWIPAIIVFIIGCGGTLIYERRLRQAANRKPAPTSERKKGHDVFDSRLHH